MAGRRFYHFQNKDTLYETIEEVLKDYVASEAVGHLTDVMEAQVKRYISQQFGLAYEQKEIPHTSEVMDILEYVYQKMMGRKQDQVRAEQS